MSLSADEFRAHLELSAATAGVRLPEVVLPDEHHLLLRRMRFHYEGVFQHVQQDRGGHQNPVRGEGEDRVALRLLDFQGP